MKRPMLPLVGSCVCGAVRVSITEYPLLTMVCHCRDCQKMTSSAFSLISVFPANGVVISGDLVEGGLQTGKRRHHFCARCYCCVATYIEGADTRVNVRASILDNPTWLEPLVELMVSEKLAWSGVSTKHRFDQYPTSASEFDALIKEYAREID